MAILRPENKTEERPAPVSTVTVTRSNSAAGQNTRNIPLIVGREFKARVQKRSFIITTVIMIVLVIIAAFVPTIIELLSSSAQSKLTVVNSAGPVAGQEAVTYLDNTLNTTLDKQGRPVLPGSDPNKKREFEIKSAETSGVTALRQQVKDGKLDALLVIGRASAGDLTFDYYTANSANGTTATRIRSVASQMTFQDKLTRSGLSQAQMVSLFDQPQFKATSTSDEKTGRTAAEAGAAYVLVFAGIILLFSAILNYGTQVAQGAVEEKSTRVMEIMVNAATPFQLMIGKIVGIGLAGFLQIGIMALVGVLANLAQGPIKSLILGNSSGGTAIDITSVSLGLLGIVVLYFVLGFLLYACLYAAIGSLVSRQEDVQGALAPLTYLFMAGYVSSFFAINMPDAAWVIVVSYIPFFTPMLMLVRFGVGSVAPWEVPLTVLIMVVSIVVLTFLAARIYRAGVLMYGQKPSLGKLFKLATAR